MSRTAPRELKAQLARLWERLVDDLRRHRIATRLRLAQERIACGWARTRLEALLAS
jgi:hypothetical protein